MSLPISPPYPPMEAESVAEIPGGGRQYEPKWDRFRCLAFRDGASVSLKSKSGQPLARYFPELVEVFLHLRATQFVLNCEIVVPVDGALSFDDLLLRIHPAESRVRKRAGRPSRWSTERSGQWEPLAPKLVVEVEYDHFTGGRFRHGSKLLRWRPDTAPKHCTLGQVEQGSRVSRLDLRTRETSR